LDLSCGEAHDGRCGLGFACWRMASFSIIYPRAPHAGRASLPWQYLRGPLAGCRSIAGAGDPRR